MGTASVKTAKVMRLPNTASRQKWVERIAAAWGEQIPAIIETGNLLEAAHEELVHGEWGIMVRSELPFNRQTANKLIQIANNDNVRNVSHVRHLPPSWGTLYELTKLTTEQFDAGIKSGAINPKMARKDVRELRGIEPTLPKKKNSQPRRPSMNGALGSHLKSRMRFRSSRVQNATS